MNEILNFEVFWLSYVRMRKWGKSYLRILPFPQAASNERATCFLSVWTLYIGSSFFAVEAVMALKALLKRFC